MKKERHKPLFKLKTAQAKAKALEEKEAREVTLVTAYVTSIASEEEPSRSATSSQANPSRPATRRTTGGSANLPQAATPQVTRRKEDFPPTSPSAASTSGDSVSSSQRRRTQGAMPVLMTEAATSGPTVEEQLAEFRALLTQKETEIAALRAQVASSSMMERKMNSSVGLCLALEPEMETKVELTRLDHQRRCLRL
ncbi:hypothetical protein FRX31_017449 [Thalictrum thalictroides]|uniref:Uncharacterized protein n=1 Tax=Thalictrum thalictroides TaxID=46969 RepID=A0A7J6W9A2_THATH|nr:hypothetical protein FRX31_017449 [Thalictrum thalictroides]